MGITFPWVRYKAAVPDKQAQIRYIHPSEGSVISKKLPFLRQEPTFRNLTGKTS
jgi:hypothetical protein